MVLRASYVVALLLIAQIAQAQTPQGRYVSKRSRLENVIYRMQFTVKPTDIGPLSVNGVLTAQSAKRPKERYDMRVRGVITGDELIGYIKLPDKKKAALTGSYIPSMNAFTLRAGSLSLICAGKKPPAPVPTPTPTFQYAVFLLTNAANGLFIGGWQDLYHTIRCGYEGGGIGCSDTDYVTYTQLTPGYGTLKEAQDALCANLTAKHVFPLGIGLKGQWQGGEWYGLWHTSVRSLCPNVSEPQ